MKDLLTPIAERVARRMEETAAGHSGVQRLINEVLPDPDVDMEQLITFLDESPATAYRKFATELREAFAAVLRDALSGVRNEIGDDHSYLYAVLLDMHSVPGSTERLSGILTLNYDLFLEHAIVKVLGREIDYGVSTGAGRPSPDAVPVLKLHGSFGWTWAWPLAMSLDHDTDGVWIPPGIRKPKTEYPFNAIWGMARELLDCDIVRLIGCNLGSNDWDLISLLFSTHYTHTSAEPYAIEVISSPSTAKRINDSFPYLKAKSLVELPDVGTSVALESQATGGNTFEYWLTLKAEQMLNELETVDTHSGIFARFALEMAQ
ncbi:MAG: hypothetical protein WD557_03790 [Dehalococcoidia bacterium]